MDKLISVPGEIHQFPDIDLSAYPPEALDGGAFDRTMMSSKAFDFFNDEPENYE